MFEGFALDRIDVGGVALRVRRPCPVFQAGHGRRLCGPDAPARIRPFGVVGHDRGAYVAYRMALDHSAAVTRLAVLDAVPIADALGRADARFAQRWWHWFFLGQTDKPAEDVITPDWYRLSADRMGAEAYNDVMAAVSDPATVHAMCEDYRAGLGVDRAADEADRAAGRRAVLTGFFGGQPE